MNNLREIREGKNVSQMDLVRATGITPGTISNLERGRIHAYRGWRKRLAEALGEDESKIFPEEVENDGRGDRSEGS